MKFVMSRMFNKILLSIVIAILAEQAIATTDPCAVRDFGYEIFIHDILENTPIGTVIGSVDVYGSPTEIELTQDQNFYVSLDPVSRNITLEKELDTDKMSSTMVVFVRCRLLNVINSQEIKINVRLILVDVNDNTPTFPFSQYQVNVSEDAAVDSVIYRGARATDADQEGGGNDQIFYSILPGPYSDYFDIEFQLYPDIKLKKPLDFEKLKSLSIVIQAMDSPLIGDRLSSTAIVNINVVDVDDLSPAFDSLFYTASVDASGGVGALVQTVPRVHAQDQDLLNAPIAYELIDQEQKFKINTTSGAISVKSNLSDPFYAAVIKAVQTDNALRYGIALLRINVQGLNDSVNLGPSFRQKVYETTVSESQPVGTTVMSIMAHYSSEPSKLKYAILEKKPVFAVDNSGNIVLMQELDYDEMETEYTFTLQATDGLRTASAVVHVRVSDINDNNPTLLESQYTVTSERVLGTELTVLQASDKDRNDKLDFQLLTHTGLFAVNSAGVISIIGQEKDLIEDEYALVVHVSDNGTPPRATIAIVTVKFASPPTPSPQVVAMAGDDTLAIVFGAIAAVLLIIIVILIVYIIRTRLYTEEHLNKARLQKGMDPKGLTYKPGDPSPDPSRLDIDLKFDGELEETSDIDGATSIQENPLSDNRMKYAFANSHEGSGEIRLETAVIPYGNSFNNYEERRAYQNGVLKTFHAPEGSSSGESNHSDSTGDSNKGLMKIGGKSNPASSRGDNNMSWDSNERISSYDSEETLQMNNKRKSKGKPEITVYF